MSDDSTAGSDVEVLLDYLRRNRGFDFTGYKRNSLTRRIDKRMQAVGIPSYLDYEDYLEVVPEEFTHLFNTILINVTGFFRDPPAWEFLADEILPDILAARQPDEPLRIWSAGCASGQEAYTLAMLCAEVLGVDGFRERVKIYATDVDEEALNQARSARYSAKEVEGVPADLLQRYFERNGQGHFVFSKDLRRSVIFGRHDLIQDAPISRIDLLVCRNTLMYFNSEIQAHILGRFAFALREGGYLFLGKAEMLLANSSLFSAVDPSRRVFRQVPQRGLRERLMALGESGNAIAKPQPRARSAPARRRWTPAARRSWWWTEPATWCWPTPRRARCSTCRPTTWESCSRISRSPTGRWSCAPRSSRPTSTGSRPSSTGRSGPRAWAR
jgi:two-component system, chemotaxis family, CheB/CheR fusion protein